MKKLIVLILMLLPMGLMAQEVKVAVVDISKLYEVMPEVKKYQEAMDAATKEWEKQIADAKNEHDTKYADLVEKGDSLADNIKQWRTQELVELQQKLENLYNYAQKSLADKEKELMAPIQEKIEKAIKDVGDENGYTYILHPQAVLYQSPSAIDATEKVIAKLGIK